MTRMNTMELLDQNVVWRTGDGILIRLEDMDAEHRRNTLAMLRRRAEYQYTAYAFCELRLMVNAPDEDYDEWVSITDSPQVWLERRPLIIELARLVKKDELEQNTVDGEVVPEKREIESGTAASQQTH